MREALLKHWYDSLSTTGLNPKHDGVFGFGFCALACLAEMSMGPLSSAITVRLSLRSLTECRISLAYLVRNGTDEMWKKFSSYGAGQPKLALLKREDMSSHKPRFVTQAALEALANEDNFQVYVEINLGHWYGKKTESAQVFYIPNDRFGRFLPVVNAGSWPLSAGLKMQSTGQLDAILSQNKCKGRKKRWPSICS